MAGPGGTSAAADREAYVTELMLHALDQTGDRSAALASFARRVSDSEAQVLRQRARIPWRDPPGLTASVPPVLVLAAVAVGTVPGAAILASAHWPYRSPAAAHSAVAGAGPELGPGRGGGAGRAGRGARPLRRRRWCPVRRVPGAARCRTGVRAPTAFSAAARLAVLAASAALLALLCWVLAGRHRRGTRGQAAAPRPAEPAGARRPQGARSPGGGPPGGRRLLRPRPAVQDRDQRGHARLCLTRPNWPRSWPTNGPTCGPGTIWCCCRSAPWPARSPRARLVRRARTTVALLVEMLADDQALRQRPARELATALLRVGVSGAGQAPCGRTRRRRR